MDDARTLWDWGGVQRILVVFLYDISVGLNIKKKGKGIVRRNFSVVVFVEGGLSRVTELHS